MSRTSTAMRVLVAASALSALALAGCGAPASTTPSASPSGSVSCAKDSLKTHTAGKLTIATDKPAYSPWFVDDDPSNGKGYEAAVAYAIADKLGFAKSDVTWVRATFTSVTSPGAKPFDFDVNQVSITDERKNAVDFSSGYYTVRQAVVTTKGSAIDGKKTIADLKGAKLGGQVGTTSLAAITKQIGATTAPSVYDTNDLAVQALKNKQIDGLVVDLPTAFYVTGAQLDDGVIVGQLPASGGTPEQFGAVLDKGSALTACVSQAVDALRTDGTLTKLEAQWLAQQGAPELK